MRVLSPMFDQMRLVATSLDRSYDIRVVNNLLDDRLDVLAERVLHRSRLLVSTPTVWQLYGQRLQQNLQAQGIDIPHVVLDANENTKTTHQVEKICREAKMCSLGREGVLVALGGGVCSDLVRVAASWIRRGVRYICVPTTLICQVDAGIGIKGAVNFLGKKSFLGSFYAPESVLIDPGFLRTLPF